jgi:hypothetical protein
MKTSRESLPELFAKLQRTEELAIHIEADLKELKNRRLIKKDRFHQAIRSLDSILSDAWKAFAARASKSDFPVLIREDQVQERFKISQATLYRRRKTQEIPYIRDKEGIIWYPVVELVNYYLKSRREMRLPKTGRPRKF